jgi:guanosine-3',5'-bis(diphosphate) 3'-pyrophosphohydrolase
MTMENKTTFFARLAPRLAPSDLVRVRGAYYLAKYGHRAQVRKETDAAGQPLRYFEHPRRVAIIAMDEGLCFDPDVICACLTHDVEEDTDDIDAAIIEQFLGSEVARLVRILTKEPKEGYAKRLASADFKPVFVKACDRLDNLRSLAETPQEFQEKQRKETLQVYRPIFQDVLGREHVLLGLIDEELRKLRTPPG